MALLFIDGFDHYNTTAQASRKYLSALVGSISNTYARFGSGNGLYLSHGGHYIQKKLDSNKTTIYLGFATKKIGITVPTINTGWPLLNLQDESLVTQVNVLLNPNYGFNVYRNTTLLGSSASAIISPNVWTFIEVKVTISDTVGEVTIKVNESQVLNLTSQDTKNGSDYIRHVTARSMYCASGTYNHFDDFYIDDADFHGDCQVKAFMPDVDGNSADFTRSTGSNDYECVDENPANQDTDYISSETLNHKSIFGITTGALETIKGIQVNNYCRLEEAGTRKITPIVRSNGTDYSGTEIADVITADYKFESEVWELDPDDSGAWDQTKLEAAEFGLEITT